MEREVEIVMELLEDYDDVELPMREFYHELKEKLRYAFQMHFGSMQPV